MRITAAEYNKNVITLTMKKQYDKNSEVEKDRQEIKKSKLMILLNFIRGNPEIMLKFDYIIKE